jgi:hypothetical protein
MAYCTILSITKYTGIELEIKTLTGNIALLGVLLSLSLYLI